MRKFIPHILGALSLLPATGFATISPLWIDPQERTLQGVLHNEVDETTRNLRPSRMIVLLTDPRSGIVEGASASINGTMRSSESSLRQAIRFRFDPGAVLDPFSLKELHAVGVTDIASVSALDLARLYGAIANGGIQLPKKRRLIPSEEIEYRRKHLLDLVEGKREAITLARVEGMKVAGAAGHGGKDPITACFAGYFPADHPRYVCVIVIEGADVILKCQRGGLLAAPVFSFVAKKINLLDLIQGKRMNQGEASK